MIFNARAGTQPGEIIFDSEHVRAHFRDWVKKNPGKKIVLDPDTEVSSALRGYYYAAVIPELQKIEPKWSNLDSGQVHGVIKKMLFWFEAWNPDTKRIERFSDSLMSNSEWTNTKRAMNFLNKVGDWVDAHGGRMPDSKEYNRYKDSAPLVGETFEDYKNNHK